jgi:insecticidal toxin complex protein TccC
MATAQWIDAHTPTLSVADSRGLAVRNVAYCRHPLNPSVDTRITRNHFDAAGRLVASWDPRLWGTAPRPNLATTHDLQSQPLLVDSVDAGWQLSLLDQAGMARSFWDGRGSQRRTEYDQLQRPITVTEQMKDGLPPITERFAYAQAGDEFAVHNQCGQLIRHDHPAGSRSHCEYGVGGLLLAEETRFLLDLASPDWSSESTGAILEDEVFRTAQQYGASGEMLCQTDARDNFRAFAYNQAGELQEIRLRLAGASGPPQVLVSDICYDALGKVQSEKAGNGVVTTVQYAAENGRLVRLLSCDAQGKPLQHLVYAYDPAGNISSVEDKAELTRYFNHQRIDPINRYRYDSLYQLVEATGREVSQPSHGPALPAWQTTPLDPNQLRNYTQSFNYDASGNLQTRHHSGVETFEMFTSTDSNRSVAEEGSLADGFDANGNQLELLRGQKMTWDIRNQLCRVTMVRREDGSDDTESYFYDSPGHRLRKVRLTETARRTLRAEVRYLPGLEIHRDTATGEERHELGVESGLSHVRALHWVEKRPRSVRNDQLRFCLNDHLNSCTLELDELGALLSREIYYAFGGTALWAGSSETEVKYKTIRYSGKERDATGLYYYGYRYYAPWLQRWVSADPVGSVDGPNLFLFCGNSPIANVDRQGLSWSESRFRSRYGPISYLDEQSAGVGGERIAETVSGGLNLAIANLEFVASSLGSSDGREKPDPVAAYYVKNTFGEKVDLNQLVSVLNDIKDTLDFYSENSESILFVKRPYVKKSTGEGARDERLYSGVRIVPKDPKERMVISVDELNSEGTLDIAFLHAAAIDRGAHEVMPYERGYPMIASPATAYVGEGLLNGEFDDVIISLARIRLFDSDLKYFFGTKNSVDLGLKLKSDPAVRGRFLMHDAGVLSYFVKTVSYALKGPTLERYPLELRAKMSEMYRPPKGAS